MHERLNRRNVFNGFHVLLPTQIPDLNRPLEQLVIKKLKRLGILFQSGTETICFPIIELKRSHQK